MWHADEAQEDPAFAARLQAGDSAALLELAQSWGPRLYRYIARRISDPETARDLTHETFVRALAAIRRGTRPRDPAAWLYRIATNLLRDEYRSCYRNRVTLVEQVEEATSEDPHQTVSDQLRREAVRQAVLSLPVELQEVLVLRYYEELPVHKIAEIVGIPEGTVKSRLYRAYRQLEQLLAPWKGPSGKEGR